MAIKRGLGNFINGSFIDDGDISIESRDPSNNYEPVFSVKTNIDHVEIAIDAARRAEKSWSKKTREERCNDLLRLKQAFIKHEAEMAKAISLEMGKIQSESLTEAKSLSARIDLMIEHGIARVATESLYHLRAETRYHHQGVLAVLGPYNFPAHLVNAHVIPSILLGNTVVVKPSEVCPMVAEIYAKCVADAGLPKGVINFIHGNGLVGRALASHNDIDGVLFTGSYKTGRALKELLLDQPHKLLALEMGGKNFAVVMDDADLSQAVLEIILGAYLTTGQRCTATSRVLVHDRVYEQFKKMLLVAAQDLKPCKSQEPGMFGPLATKDALDRFIAGLNKAKDEGAEVLIESSLLPGGAFVTPSIYEIKKDHSLDFYLGEELFGPNLCLESFSHLDEAILRINESPYGLSNAIFTFDPRNSERIINETKSGVLNINRSTNNAFGQMPFGGVKRSGNQRPAGIDAVRYATFPMAITSLPYGETQATAALKNKIAEFVDVNPKLKTISRRHDIEVAFELVGIFSELSAHDHICFKRSSFAKLATLEEDFFHELSAVFHDDIVIDDNFITLTIREHDSDAQLVSLNNLLEKYATAFGLRLKKAAPLAINVPPNLEMPRSRAMLDRLYRGRFIPEEKKPLVADLEQSRGAYLVSVDDNPLVLFDAASQIATLGAGFSADIFQNAYDNNEFDYAMLTNYDLSTENHDDTSPLFIDAINAQKALEQFLHEKSRNSFRSIAYGASGAEANEIALDLSRQNGPGGTRILAFEGAFHGRTIMTLQATFNKEKRGPFSFKGYEATFLPFPELKDPQNQPAIDRALLKSLGEGKIPSVLVDDALLQEELKSLASLKEEVTKGNVCAVIIEPMLCEGGDRYGSNRFFSALRALTRNLKIPLIFDEVQTGFNLGREFFWYQQLGLIDHMGNPELPDCVTLAKKAQLGICLSVFENHRRYAPHIIQLKRGLLHGLAIDKKNAQASEEKARKELLRLQEYFPTMVLNIRACGFAFAFDMSSKELANALIDQRFLRGFMAYIAGEKTLRFRLNMKTSDELVNQLFEKLFLALVDLRDKQKTLTFPEKPTTTSTKINSEVRFLELTGNNFSDYQDAISIIEENAYESGRRDSMEVLRRWVSLDHAVGVLMTANVDDRETVVGYAIGGPLEESNIDGAKQDPHRGQHDTFYSANITVDEKFRGCGFGSLLKNEQIRRTTLLKNADGTPRYYFMTGRNRIGHTSAMTQINDNLGAYLVDIYDNQYGETGARAAYYRLPIAKTSHRIAPLKKSDLLDCRNSLDAPFKNPPPTLLKNVSANRMRAIIGSKLTLSNWATPHMVRYSELLRAVMPKHLKHAYFTSGRDEVLDKGLRSIRFHRLDADIVLSFSHQWFGNITSAARSLSHDENQAQPFAFFNWPKTLHPAITGMKASIEATEKHIDHFGKEKILGIVVELMGEKSGFVVDNAVLSELDRIRHKTGIPLVFVENASSFYRSGQSVFLSDSLSVKANMVLFYTGGQLGHIFVDDNYFVEKPLTLISTWDGDEISMMRAYHHLLYASTSEWSENIRHFDTAMRELPNSVERVGQGVWHAIRLKDPNKLMKAIDAARKEGILFGQGFDSSLLVCPKPDFTREDFLRVIKVVNDLV